MADYGTVESSLLAKFDKVVRRDFSRSINADPFMEHFCDK